MLAELRLKNFRSYVDDSFEFSEGVTIIVGPNASGKTNLLEAVLMLARGTSYRAKDAELIAFDTPWARLDGRLSDGSDRNLRLQRDASPAKQYEVEGKTFQRLTARHALPVVLFEPNHLQMISGGPERRREYLDDLLEQTIIGYGTTRRAYKRTLAQRNALLKRHHGDIQKQLFPWNVRLSELAGQIVRAREALVMELQSQLPALYNELSPHARTVVSVAYGSSWPGADYESRLLQKLDATRELDIARGFTGNGPHREDLLTYFSDKPAGEVASRGEIRTLVLALKVLELQLLARDHTHAPILLLDDVFSELDGTRRRALTEHLKDYQTFITTTDADIVQKHFIDSCQLIALSDR